MTTTPSSSRNLIGVLLISIGFFVQFSSYYSCQNISSKVLQDLGFGNLGFINLAIIYVTYAFSSAFVEPVVAFLGHRLTLTFSSLLYALWVATFIMPVAQHESRERGEELPFSETTIKIATLASAFFLGLGAGPLWVSQAHYVAECADERTKGRYNSLFLCLFYCSNFFASTVSGKLLTVVSKTWFYLIMSAVSVAGSLIYLTLPSPIKATDENNREFDKNTEKESQRRIENKEVDHLNPNNEKASTEMTKLASILPLEKKVLPLDLEREGRTVSVSGRVEVNKKIKLDSDLEIIAKLSTKKQELSSSPSSRALMKNPLMVAMLGPLALRGITAAAHGSIFVNFWVSTINEAGSSLPEEEKIEQAVMTYTALGAGSVLGSIVIGFITDKMGYTTSIKFTGMAVLAAFGSILVQNELHRFRAAEAYFTMFLIGMCDNSVKVFNNTILGFEFENTIGAFQIGVLAEALATSSVLLLVPLADLEMEKNTFRYLFLVYLALGIVAYVNLYRRLSQMSLESLSKTLPAPEPAPSAALGLAGDKVSSIEGEALHLPRAGAPRHQEGNKLHFSDSEKPADIIKIKN